MFFKSIFMYMKENRYLVKKSNIQLEKQQLPDSLPVYLLSVFLRVVPHLSYKPKQWPERLISQISQGWHITSTIPATWGRSSFIIYSGCLRALELNSLVKVQLRQSARGDCFHILLICLYDALFNWSILYIISRLLV